MMQAITNRIASLIISNQLQSLSLVYGHARGFTPRAFPLKSLVLSPESPELSSCPNEVDLLVKCAQRVIFSDGSSIPVWMKGYRQKLGLRVCFELRARNN